MFGVLDAWWVTMVTLGVVFVVVVVAWWFVVARS